MISTAATRTEWARSTVGVTEEVVTALLTCPDATDEWNLHQTSDTKFRTLGFWMVCIENIETSDSLSFKVNLQCAVDNLLYFVNNLQTFVRKIKNTINCDKTLWTDELCMSSVIESPKEYFPTVLSDVGITQAWLENPTKTAIDHNLVTNSVINELFKYHSTKNMCFKNCVMWEKHLFCIQKNRNINTIRSQWTFINKKIKKLRRSKEEQYTFLSKVYSPTQKTGKLQDSNIKETDHFSKKIDIISKDNLSLKLERDQFRRRVSSLNDEKKNLSLKLNKSENDLKITCAKQNRLLNRIQTYSIRNVNKRLKRKTKAISKIVSDNLVQKSKVDLLRNKIRNIKRRYQRLATIKKYYCQKSVEQASKIDAFCVTHGQQLNEIKKLQMENSELNTFVNETSMKPFVKTFENGKYCDEVRIVCYELLNHGVGTQHIPSIIQTVLKKLANIDVPLHQLPKTTLLKYMSTEAGVIAKTVAAVNLKKSTVSTLQTDGTTKKHNKYVNFMSTTSTGRVLGLGLQDHHSGDAQSQIDGLELILDELSSCLSDIDNEEVGPNDFAGREAHINEFIIKFKNTMTDRHIVNKKFVKILEQWRTNILPNYIPHWDTLTEEKKQELISINDFYCGFHFILGLQDNFETNIKEWEKLEAGGGKIGREKTLLWHRKGSASLECIRSSCTAFGKEACEKSGKPKEFSAFIGKHVLLESFKHNRFNVPFTNASFTYYHLQDMKNFIATLDKDRNMLMKCIGDLKDPIIVAGVRAMGMIEKHITTPLMALIKSSISITEISEAYSHLFKMLKTWSNDPSDILEGNACLFEDILPIKNNVYDCLYQVVEPDIQELTRQALSIGCTGFLVVTERMLKDHLPGGKFNNPDSAIISDSAQVPNHNIAPEQFFSGLDRLVRKMPTANTIGIEGILLWSMNKSLQFLDSLSPSSRQLLISKARSTAPDLLKKYRERKALIKQKINEKVIERAEKVAQKENKAVQCRLDIIQKLNTLYGGPVTSIDELNSILRNTGGELKQIGIIKTIIRFEKIINYQAQFCRLYQFQKDGNKRTLKELKYNLETILKSRNTTNPVAESSTKRKLETIIVNEPLSKKLRIVDHSNEQLSREVFKFKVCEYVAVAYNEGWYVGIVQDILHSRSQKSVKANVKFMSWVDEKLIWPQPENVEIVESKFVFMSNLDICTVNGRLYFIGGNNKYDDVNNVYSLYSNKYFA